MIPLFEKFKNNKNVRTQILLVVGILIAGVVIFKVASSLHRPPKKKISTTLAPLLDAEMVTAADMQMTVSGFGTVQPKVEVRIVPQVSGVVVAIDDDFVDGGFFEAQQALITIDQRDYKLAVENAEAAVARAQVQLDQELAEAMVARQEWSQLHPDTEPSSPLVLREPQICQAKAELKAVEAQLAIAALHLERTVISMPFDGRVTQKSVDLGQYISATQPIGTVYGTDVAEIVVPLEDRDLEWFDVPLVFKDNNPTQSVKEADVTVTAQFAGARHTWAGRIVRVQGRIDSKSRIVNVVAEVADPFNISAHRVPLVPGMFVEVSIDGKKLENVIRVRRHAVHNFDEVWLAEGGRLNIRKVKVVRRDKQFAYITSGIADGDIIITSPLDTVADGMEIRTNLSAAADEQERLSK